MSLMTPSVAMKQDYVHPLFPRTGVISAPILWGTSYGEVQYSLASNSVLTNSPTNLSNNWKNQCFVGKVHSEAK